MKKNNNFKQLLLLPVFILTSSFVFAVSNSCDNFNGSSTIVNSIVTTPVITTTTVTTTTADTSPATTADGSTSQESEGGSDTAIVQTNVALPASVGKIVSGIASFFDAMEGGSTPQTTAASQQQLQQDLFAEPGVSTEPSTTSNDNSVATESNSNTEASSSESGEAEGSDSKSAKDGEKEKSNIKVSSTRDYY